VFESVEQESQNTFTHLSSLVSLLATAPSEDESADDESLIAVREPLTD
jgi:hypothetical protein